jgi:hypothetical protein
MWRSGSNDRQTEQPSVVISFDTCGVNIQNDSDTHDTRLARRSTPVLVPPGMHSTDGSTTLCMTRLTFARLLDGCSMMLRCKATQLGLTELQRVIRMIPYLLSSGLVTKTLKALSRLPPRD